MIYIFRNFKTVLLTLVNIVFSKNVIKFICHQNVLLCVLDVFKLNRSIIGQMKGVTSDVHAADAARYSRDLKRHFSTNTPVRF